MQDVTGQGCNFGTPPVRDDLPLHDMTGGSTWLPTVLNVMYPTDANDVDIIAGADRARAMLQGAADISVFQEDGDQIRVRVINNTGHKLPTGYPEGRRMFINVKFLDAADQLILESAAYNDTTGELAHTASDKIYHIELGIDTDLAAILGLTSGPSLHFVLNNYVVLDNRIPPQGFTNAAFETFGGPPVNYTYADGQFWDDTYYPRPAGTASVEVKLYYQSTSKEFMEFLRDENDQTPLGAGQAMYDLWNNNGKCPPELMTQASLDVSGPLADFDNDLDVDLDDLLTLAYEWGSVGIQCDIAAPYGVVDYADFAAFAADWLWTL